MPPKITIGCDPELAVRIKGKIVNASEYFKGTNTPFGTDGHSATAELRPGYAEDPLDLTCKIEKLLNISKQIPNLELYAGHYKDNKSIGGHIHFGSTILTSSLLKANCITVYSLFNKVLEPQEEYRQRSNGSYGSPTDMRQQDYGWEYRYPPSWLLSPSVTLVYLSAARAIADATAGGEEIKLVGKNDYQKLDSFLQEYSTFSTSIGLSELKKIAKKRTKLNWSVNILENW